MEIHKANLVREKKELDEKLEKIIEYIQSPNFNKLQPREQSLMDDQADLMENYSDILQDRIDLL